MGAFFKGVSALAGGYLCACFVAVLVVRVAQPGVISDTDFPIAVAFVGMKAFPGFVGLRLAMWWGRVRTIGVFALAGALNATITIFLLQFEVDVNWVLNGAGLVAGAVYHVVEMAIGTRIMTRRELGTAE